jgi:hypothetical protein
MNITTKENMKKVLCESSYLDWFQKANPTFIDVLQKINEECGVVTNPSHSLNRTAHEYVWLIHGIKVVVVHTKEKLSTSLSLSTAKYSWVTFNDPSNLYMDFLSAYLVGIRIIWYEVNPP